MRIEITPLGSYQLINIEEDLNVIADLEELFFLVKGYIEQGKLKIAVKFPGISYIYSGAIAILLKCVKLMKEGKGELCIIEKNPDIRGIFASLNLHRLIHIYESEEALVSREVEESDSYQWGTGGLPA